MLTNPLEWDLVVKRNYLAAINQAYSYLPIPDVSLVVDKRVLAIGVTEKDAKANWYTGGWARMDLLVSPSSTSNFTAAMQAGARRISLGRMNLVQFPELNSYPYLLTIHFPPYFKNTYLEIWKYNGSDRSTDNSTILQTLNRIESEIILANYP